MTYFLSLIAIALAVSVDSFGVGLTYGLRQVRIPIRSILIIALCSFSVAYISAVMARGMLLLLPALWAERLGGLILIGLGVWALCTGWRKEDEYLDHGRGEESDPAQTVWTLELKRMGIVIHILKRPMVADMDRSGVISVSEALFLGLALSMDAFAAGLGASLMGYSPLLTALSLGVMSSLFLFLGLRFGSICTGWRWTSHLIYLPPLVLIIIGLLRLI